MADVEAADPGEDAQEVDADVEEESLSVDDRVTKLTPSYPFPAEFRLEFQGAWIEVIRHLCQRHPSGTRAIVLFFPGVHGGVGPCRQPGENFDEDALFATVARGLVSRPDSDVDCYRCSWPYMRPRMGYAVGGACRVLHHALLEATKGSEREDDREIQVFIVGHSLGGAVAIQSSEVIARHFGDGGRGRQTEGLEHLHVRVAGLCTLNGALDITQVDAESFSSLSSSRALFICGDADDVVPPDSTRGLYEGMPIGDKRILELPGGSHDLFTFKQQLVGELTAFILEGLGPQAAMQATLD